MPDISPAPKVAGRNRYAGMAGMREAGRTARGSGRTAFASVAVVAVVVLTAWGLLGTAPGQGRPGQAAPGQASASPSASSSSVNPVAGPGWKLKFSAVFTGSQLNTKIWGTCFPWHDVPAGCTNYGNKHPEQEWYLPAQDRVANGALKLIAQRLPTPGQDRQGRPVTYQCRSGLVTTYPSFRFKYGYIQIIARFPYGYGLWPALWLAAANLKWPPEIDIIEHWGTHPNANVAFHRAGLPQITHKTFPSNLSVGWHSFGLLWSQHQLVWFIDGHKMFSFSKKEIPTIPMYFIANIAESKPVQASRGCEGTMHIRSVKVWQQN